MKGLRLLRLSFVIFIVKTVLSQDIVQNSPKPTTTSDDDDDVGKFLASELSLATSIPPAIIPRNEAAPLRPPTPDELPNNTEKVESAPSITAVPPTPEDTLVIAVVNGTADSSKEVDVDTFTVDADSNFTDVTNVKPIADELLKELLRQFNAMEPNITTIPDSFPDPPPLIVVSDETSSNNEDSTPTPADISATTDDSVLAVLFKLPEVISQLNSTEPASSGAQIEGEKPFGQFFCLAHCMASCFNTESVDPPLCRDICSEYESSHYLCAASDNQCWKNCNKEMSVPAYAPAIAPVIIGANNIDSADFTSQTIRMYWDPVPNATLYVVEIIPNPTSMMNGAIMVRDMSLTNLYEFQKPNLCYEYYVRAAAVNTYGVGQFGASVFVQNTAPQLPLTFRAIDSYVRDASLDIRPSGLSVDHSPHTVVILSYEDGNTMLNLANFDLTYYLLASECQQPVDKTLFEETVQSSTVQYSTVYKVNAVKYVYDPFAVTLYLPASILHYDCKYTFRVAAVTNTCGQNTVYATVGYNSEVGTEFRLSNVLTVNLKQEKCHVTNLETSLILYRLRNALESNVQSLIVVPNLPVSTDCQMTGFTADIMGGKKNDKYNVTIRWDAIVDGFPKVYFVRHGSALRSLIFSTSDDILFDYDDPVPVVDDINNIFTKSMSLPSMDKTVLHSFQICAAYGSVSSEDFPWDFALKHIVDLAAYEDQVVSQSMDDTTVFAVVNEPCNPNKPNVSWIVVVASLFVAILCFTLMLLVVVHYVCCRRRKVKKIFVKNIATIEPQQVEKPAPIIAA